MTTTMATTPVELSSEAALFNTSLSSTNDQTADDKYSETQLSQEFFEIRRQFHQFHRYFVSWIIPVYFVIGLLGTILCLVVLIRNKRRKYTSQITHWFIALSLSDCYVLVLGLSLMYVTRLHYFVDVKTIEPRRWNAFSCYCINTLIYFGLLFSTWVQAGISVLRALSTCMPITVRVHLSSSRSLICLSVTAGTSLLTAFLMIRLGMHYGSDSQMQPNGTLPKWRCSLQENGASQAFFYVSLILKVLLPWILLVLASISILSSLVRFRRSFTDCASISIPTETTLATGRNHSEHWSTTSSLHRRVNRASSSNTSRRSHRLGQEIQQDAHAPVHYQRSRPDSANRKRFQQKRISYVLLGMNLSFLCFNLPFEVWKIYYERNPPDIAHPAPLIINIFLNILVYTNNATNWLFYFMLGRRFRGQVRRLLSSLLVCGSRRYKHRSGLRTPMGPATRTQRAALLNRQHQPHQQYKEHSPTPQTRHESRPHQLLTRTNNIIDQPCNGAEM